MHATAVAADDALAQIAAFAPDLIPTDADAGLDGLALTRRLKADAATRHIVIVAFTAGAIEGDAMKLRAAGCDGYLGKPIDVASFARHIRSHLAPPD
jgi:two-component system cell cycle response regulator DivK